MNDERTLNAPVKTAQRTLRVVEALKELDGATIKELSSHLDMSKSSTHDYLKTLEHEGYVVRDEYTYRVGLRFLDIGGYARVQHRLYLEASPKMEELARETGELVNLLVEEHGRGCFLSRSRGANAVNLETYVGECIELHTTALGKTILAYLPRWRVEEIVERHGLEGRTENTITDPEELYEHLDGIRSEGTAVAMEERIHGLCGVAVPVVPDDRIVGAMSITGPLNRMKSEQVREEHVARLQNVRNVVELNLQHDYK